MYKVTANIHSLKNKAKDENHQAEVNILSRKSDNDIVAEYNGVKCTAIYNCFNGQYYVDDVYGIIEDERK